MKRRGLVVGGTLASLSLAARAQQSARPRIGYLTNAWPGLSDEHVGAFRRGLAEAGYAEGRGVEIEFRFAEGRTDRLPELAADLVRRGVTVIAAVGGTAAAFAARQATTTIPIVFEIGSDPVREGLVTSLNRPGGNMTGVTALNAELNAKRLALLCELVPTATRIGVLTSPRAAGFAEDTGSHLRAAAAGRRVEIVAAGNGPEIEAAVGTLAQDRADALLVTASAAFFSLRARLVALAARHALPAMYPDRRYAEAGGLISYGTDGREPFRLVGVYVGRILGGERPENLPVQRATRIETVVNLATAGALGLAVPPPLLAAADEVIE